LRVALFGGTAKSATAAMVKAQAEVDGLALTEGVTPCQLAEARQRLLEEQPRLHIVSNRLKAVLTSLANLFFNYASPWLVPADGLLAIHGKGLNLNVCTNASTRVPAPSTR
jgi:hypothetical protein